jgi:hypothetical protein
MGFDISIVCCHFAFCVSSGIYTSESQQTCDVEKSNERAKQMRLVEVLVTRTAVKKFTGRFQIVISEGLSAADVVSKHNYVITIYNMYLRVNQIVA